MSKYSAGVYSTSPAPWTPDRSAELQAEVDGWAPAGQALRPDGPAIIETFTIRYRRDGSRVGIVVGRLEGDNRRFVARGEDHDEELLGLLTGEQPAGEKVFVRSAEAGNRVTTSRR
jgi:acetyl-CoA C-acetyltransferase